MSEKNYAIAIVFGMLFGYILSGFGPAVKSVGAEPQEFTAFQAGELTFKHLKSKYDPDSFRVSILNVSREADVYVVEASISKLVPQETESFIVPTSGGGVIKEVIGVQTGGDESNAKKVKIVEYADFQCPYCARAAETIQQIKDTYGDKVEIEYRHFPLSFHPYAQMAAEAAECARDQGKFWEYHDLLFENSNSLSGEKIKQFASDLGLDTGKFDTCLDSGEKSRVVRQQMLEGQRQGVRGTPAFFIDGELVSGAQPFSVFSEKIDEKLG
jgi:protein-disulfide isomerase